MKFKIGMTALLVALPFTLLGMWWPPLMIVGIVAIGINVPLLLSAIWTGRD